MELYLPHLDNWCGGLDLQLAHGLLDQFSDAFYAMGDARLKKMRNFPGIWSKIASKCDFFNTNYQNFLEEKD